MGTYASVDAVFTPAGTSSSNADFTYSGSTSTPTQSFTVDPASENTTTSLNAVTSPITYGSETTETFSGTVSGQSGDGNPQGTVTVSYGTPTATELCQSTLTASGANAATFSCALTASQLDVGAYASVDAVFTPAGTSSSSPDFTYTGSTSTPTQSFTVDPASEATTTSLNAVTSPVTYGAETSETFSGTVTGASGDGYPEGTLSVQSGTTVLCSETLPAGATDVASFSCSPTSGTVLGASATPYPVTATFTPGTTSSSNADFTYSGSTSSPAQSLTVNAASEVTTTSLNAVTSPVTSGAETTETFSGTVTGQSGDGNPEGTVTVSYGTPTATELCQSTLTVSGANAATFNCVLTASQLPVGTYASVVAVFTPATTSSTNANFTYTGSTSTPTQSFVVSSSVSTEPTTTSLNAVTSPITYGAETAETFTGTVTGQSGDGYPEGTLSVQSGTTAPCSEHPARRNNRRGHLQLCADRRPARGGRLLERGRRVRPRRPLVVEPGLHLHGLDLEPDPELHGEPESAGTTTSLSAVTSPITYGSETSETFSGTVTGQSGDGNPAGTVTVYYGTPTATELCQSTLTVSGANAATFGCALTASQLTVGTYASVDAVFTPAGTSSSNADFTYSGSTSTPTQSFTVDPASENTTTSLNAVTSPITYGSETTETFSGTVSGQSGDGNPAGTVTVSYGTPTATELCQSTLTASGANAATFNCALTASQLDVGAYASVVAVFAPAGTSSSSPDFTYTGSTSTPTQSFTVDPASEATTTSLNAVTSPVTYGAETSEIFSGTVTGASGDGYPEGTLSVQSGTTVLCSETLPAGTTDVASFSCSPTSGTVLGASATPYPVTATFTPGTTSSSNADFTYSARPRPRPRA